MVTIRDVAREAGVSAPTVSRVLSNKNTVDPELRAKVLDAVRRLGYRPDRAARALRRRIAHTFAFIIPDIQNTFFTSVLRGLEDRAHTQDYAVLLCNTDDNLDRQRNYIELLRAEGVAGVAICAADESMSRQQIESLRDRGVAIVAVDRILLDSEVDTVLADNVQGARDAVAHLLATGHTRIGLIAGPDYFAPGRERRQGYEAAYEAVGREPDLALIKITDFTPASATIAARELLSLPPDRCPTAIFACSSRLALATLGVITTMGLRIPEEVALISFDDADWASCYCPPVTVVEQPAYQIGATACDLMIRRLANHSVPPEEVRLATRLILRRSCCQQHTTDQPRPIPRLSGLRVADRANPGGRSS